MNRSLTVGPSSINGLGVFAEKGFLAGENVLTIDDSYHVDESHPIPAGEEQHCDFLSGGQIVWMQLPERHINHSCEPNVYVDDRSGIRRVVAIREIKAGEEITYDYSINGFGDVVWQCHCGAGRCRKLVHSDFFHLPLELQTEYLPYLNNWYRLERHADVEALTQRVLERELL